MDETVIPLWQDYLQDAEGIYQIFSALSIAVKKYGCLFLLTVSLKISISQSIKLDSRSVGRVLVFQFEYCGFNSGSLLSHIKCSSAVD